MADGPANKTHDANVPAASAGSADELPSEPTFEMGAEEAEWSSWGNLWQIPAIVLSLALIGLGLYTASQRAPEQDLSAVLTEVERMIRAGDFENSKRWLQDVVEPGLELSSPGEEARYHAVLADWVSAYQDHAGVSVPTSNRVIADEYGRASELGARLDAVRIERWAQALVELGEIESARERIAALEALEVTEAGSDARPRRNRILRQLVELSLRRSDLPPEALLEVIESYRSDPLLDAEDRAWASAREAQLRLASGRASEAVEHLFVDMRRLERAEDPIDPAAWGELYGLLARGFFDQGRYDHAEYYLDQALERLPRSAGARGDALSLRGRLHLALNEPERAFERFDAVVRDFVDTDAFLPALLSRAEVASVLGHHEASLEDYRSLLSRAADFERRTDVTRERISASLADRHDAALTRRDFALALEYVDLAERLFTAMPVPGPVLRRIASTSRQIADHKMALALSEAEGGHGRLELVDPTVRHEAAMAYERAADYFVRHARALAGVVEGDALWAESLWLSADSYDLAGLRDIAARHFREYVAARPIDDPRRAEAIFRLAQTYEAEAKLEEAAAAYAQIIAEHPRSTFGTGSHVPLARCYAALGRERDAEDVLVRVVDGRAGAESPITPDALDYRDALIELGKLYHERERYPEAIERLEMAADRYGADERADEIRFRLADAYRRHALAIRDRLRGADRLAPQERRGEEQLARTGFERALDLFSRVVNGYRAREGTYLEPRQRDEVRLATMYRADCADALGKYEAAAALYDQAARRYSDHHSSMHALVQIVNCFHRLGRVRDADIAHQNALTRLRQLPDEAFDDPGALMDRAAWERWLRNRPVGPTRVTGGTGG